MRKQAHTATNNAAVQDFVAATKSTSFDGSQAILYAKTVLMG